MSFNYNSLNDFIIKKGSPKYFKNKFFKVFSNLSKKQIIGLIIVPVTFISNYIYAQTSGSGSGAVSKAFVSLNELLLAQTSGSTLGTLAFQQTFVNMFTWVEMPRNLLRYIADAQTQSIDIVSRLPFGSRGMFEHIYIGLTIFAVIGAVYKLVTHFLKTERFDNVKAFTGFFSYLGIIILFVFSGEIVGRVTSLNKNLKNNQLQTIAETLDTELSNALVGDYKRGLKKMQKLEETREENTSTSLLPSFTGVQNEIKFYAEKMEIIVYDLFVALVFKYGYYTFFIALIVCILAIPTFVMAFMVKVLLGVMIAGTKLVFLVSMIPGFESTWKTYMLNLLNVILWIPIFNEIIFFIQSIMAEMIHSQSMGAGEIIWMTVVCFICSYQAVTLTTTTAGTIISGAGASMAGALGGMSAMNGASVLASAGGMVAGGVGTVASGGMTAGMTASSLKKFMK